MPQDYDPDRIRAIQRPVGLPFDLNKIGHVVLMVTDLERSTRFYVEALGFRISDVYPESMMPGGMVFLRCNADHHGIALVGGARCPSANAELHHMAFEVSSLDEVVRVRDHLHKHKAQIDFEGRRRAGVQIAVEFRDPDGHRLEVYWGLDRVGSDGVVRPASEWKGASSLKEAIADPVRGQDTTLRDLSLAERL
jgi:catechol 2,3-dioxygenase